MSERVGVVNLHLVVDVTEDNTMTTLYKIDQGFVKENHYGLKLARVVDLPSEVLTVAEKVSQTLDAQVASKQKSSKAFALAKRRKLVLSLVETLKQAEISPMDDKVLLNWLWKLQCEFVRRMEEIESDTRVDTEDISENEDRETPRDTAPSETQASDTLS